MGSFLFEQKTLPINGNTPSRIYSENNTKIEITNIVQS